LCVLLTSIDGRHGDRVQRDDGPSDLTDNTGTHRPFSRHLAPVDQVEQPAKDGCSLTGLPLRRHAVSVDHEVEGDEATTLGDAGPPSASGGQAGPE
jgi:hypothetical protein